MQKGHGKEKEKHWNQRLLSEELTQQQSVKINVIKSKPTNFKLPV